MNALDPVSIATIGYECRAQLKPLPIATHGYYCPRRRNINDGGGGSGGGIRHKGHGARLYFPEKADFGTVAPSTDMADVALILIAIEVFYDNQ